MLYWLVFNKRLRLQNFFIVVVSCIFYGWWDKRFLLLIIITILASFLSGILIERYSDNRRKARWICGGNIVLNLLILGLFKYYDFFVTTFTHVFLGSEKNSGLLLHLVLPVGISFYTFQALSYSIDVYRRKIEATHDFIAFFAFISFFPQLVAGPIERATNLLPQFLKPRSFDYVKAVDGMRQILWGFFKKVVVADNCAVYVNRVFDNYEMESGSSLLIGAIFFSFQIYGDFSGYSDIAIGTGRLFGINLMRNFNFPYLSRDIAEFWRKWHISLTTWFRDYIYIPLGGSRVSRGRIVRNTMIIFLVSGLWHGANLTFVAWGMFHAFLFLPLICFNKNRKYLNVVAEGRFYPSWKEFYSMLSTFLLVTLGWIIFRANTLTDAVRYIDGIFTPSLLTFPAGKIQILFCMTMITIMLFWEWLNRTKQHAFEISFLPQKVRYFFYILLVFIVLFFRGTSSSFIYFQF